jgi:predicted transcriptional regulator
LAARTNDAERETLEAMLVRLPSDLREQVRERATAEERTQAQVVRRALRYYLTQVPA